MLILKSLNFILVRQAFHYIIFFPLMYLLVAIFRRYKMSKQISEFHEGLVDRLDSESTSDLIKVLPAKLAWN